jgi:uncharacterized membrane protein
MKVVRREARVLNKKLFITIWVILSAVFAAILLSGFYYSQNKTGLIVMYGIRTANTMVTAIIVIAVIALVLSFLMFFNAYRKKYRPAPKARVKPEPEADVVDINNEEYIRGKLTHFADVRPRLRDELAECLSQMDSINEKQASLNEIRRRSNAGCLQLVEDSLDVAERSIWNNLQAVINIAEIWDPKEAGDPEWGNIYEKRRKSVRAYIKLNNDLLREGAILLTDGTTLANDKTQSSEGAKRELEASIETIAKLRDMSGTMEVE